METAEVRAWLAIGWGEGSAEQRIVRNDSEMVQWLWDQCGPDFTGEEAKTRAFWFAYLANEDNWTHLADLRMWRCDIDIGETGHVEFIALLDDVAETWLKIAAK